MISGEFEINQFAQIRLKQNQSNNGHPVIKSKGL